eukprot:gene23909-9478_t
MAVPSLAMGSLSEAVSEYERERIDRIAENKRKIEELGLKSANQRMSSVNCPKPKAERKTKVKADPDFPAEIRRTGREVKKVSYKEEDYFGDLPRGGGGGRVRGPPRVVDEATLEEMRANNGLNKGEEPSASQIAKLRAPIDSGKGVRIQGGRVYDSKFGVTCHWCRQKTLEDHVSCAHPGCGHGGKSLPTTFCKMCLKNRHGEDVEEAFQSGKWVCPKCRGSCGKGCVQCCNCGPCRKKAGLDPTGNVMRSVREAGFDNVHDYLINLVTGELPEEIAARKGSHPWAAWITGAEAPWEGDGCLHAAHEQCAKKPTPKCAKKSTPKVAKRKRKSTDVADAPAVALDPAVDAGEEKATGKAPKAADASEEKASGKAPKAVGASAKKARGKAPTPVDASEEKASGKASQAVGGTEEKASGKAAEAVDAGEKKAGGKPPKPQKKAKGPVKGKSMAKPADEAVAADACAGTAAEADDGEKDVGNSDQKVSAAVEEPAQVEGGDVKDGEAREECESMDGEDVEVEAVPEKKLSRKERVKMSLGL